MEQAAGFRDPNVLLRGGKNLNQTLSIALMKRLPPSWHATSNSF